MAIKRLTVGELCRQLTAAPDNAEIICVSSGDLSAYFLKDTFISNGTDGTIVFLLLDDGEPRGKKEG